MNQMNERSKDNWPLDAYFRKAEHDIRTPLTSISGFAELLLEDESLNPAAREHAGIILEEAKRLAGLLDAFFSQLEASGSPE